MIVQAEQRKRISFAQDEEEKWATHKTFLRREYDKMPHWQVSNAGKISDRFVLSEDSMIFYLGRRLESSESPEEDTKIWLVVLTTTIDEIVPNSYHSVEGGHQGIVRTNHRVNTDYYAEVTKHVQECEDCSTSKSKSHLKRYSPGNVVSDQPYQVVSMDVVIPLPVTQRGNTALLLFLYPF